MANSRMLKPTYSVWNKEEPMQHWKEHVFLSIYKRRITYEVHTKFYP
jgi:hypothetical protein